MATLSRWQKPIQDAAGNVLEAVQIEVRREAPGLPLARIYSDRAGEVAKANPFTAAEVDDCFFHATGGAYRVRATKVIDGNLYERILRYQAIGTYGEADQGAVVQEGFLFEYEAETVSPPSVGFFRLDNADISLATTIWVSKTTRGGYDIGARLLELDPGTNLVKSTLHIRGTEIAGASWLVESADDSGGADDFVTLTLSAHDGSTELTTENYSLQREIAGADGEDSAQSVNGQTAAATGKTTPVDADLLAIVDSEASNALKKLTFANLAVWIGTKLGGLINGLAGKTTPVDADAIAITDSAASNAGKKVTLTNFKAFLKTYFDTLYPATTKFTDWTAYSPTFNGLGTVTATSVFWRRVGDTLEIQGTFTPGTVTASEARMSLPSGVIASATKLRSGTNLCGSLSKDTAVPYISVVLIEQSATYLTFGIEGNGSNSGLTKVNGNTSFGSQVQSLRAAVPVDD